MHHFYFFPNFIIFCRKCPVTVHLIVQRDLVGSLSRSSHYSRYHTNKHNPINNNIFKPINSLLGHLCKSHMSVASNVDLDAAGSKGELFHIVSPRLERKKRYGSHYTSHSQLYPEFHTNPYVSPSIGLKSSSQRHMHFGSVHNSPRAGSGRTDMISQLGFSDESPDKTEPQALYGSRRNGHGDLDVDEEMCPGYGAQGHMSYGTGTLSRKIFHNISSAFQASKEDISNKVNDLSHTIDLIKDFCVLRGSMGGSMRIHPHSKPHSAGADYTSLAQYEDRQEEERGAVGNAPFTRRASMTPHGTAANSTHRSDHNHVQHRTISPLVWSDVVDTIIDANSTTSVHWEVCPVSLWQLLLMFLSFPISPHT